MEMRNLPPTSNSQQGLALPEIGPAPLHHSPLRNLQHLVDNYSHGGDPTALQQLVNSPRNRKSQIALKMSPE